MGKRDEGTSAAVLVKSAVLGTGAAAVLAVLLAAILAAVILAGMLPENALRTAAIAAVAFAAFGGGLLASGAAGRSRLPVAMGAMAIFGLLLFLGKTAFHTQTGTESLPSILAIAGGGVAAGLMSSKRKKRRR